MIEALLTPLRNSRADLTKAPVTRYVPNQEEDPGDVAVLLVVTTMMTML